MVGEGLQELHYQAIAEYIDILWLVKASNVPIGEEEGSVVAGTVGNILHLRFAS